MGIDPSPTPFGDQTTLIEEQGGGWLDESISGCGLARDCTPRPGLKQSLVAEVGLH